MTLKVRIMISVLCYALVATTFSAPTPDDIVPETQLPQSTVSTPLQRHFAKERIALPCADNNSLNPSAPDPPTTVPAGLLLGGGRDDRTLPPGLHPPKNGSPDSDSRL